MKNNKQNKNIKEKLFAVTGYRGRLGSSLVSMGYVPIECNVRNPKETKEIIGDLNPDVLINCAAITDVDECELSLRRESTQVNGIGVAVIRDSFYKKMVHISTDYIFDGRNGPYSENSNPSPISQYGLSKLLGEELFREYNYPGDVIVRTTILYGSKDVRNDFVVSVVNKLCSGNEVELPMNLYGTPTYVPHLALAIHHIAKMGFTRDVKIINVAGKDCISRYEFGLMIADVFDLDANLVVPTKRIDGVAQRPKHAGLKIDLAKDLEIPVFSLREGLLEMKEIWKSHLNTAS